MAITPANSNYKSFTFNGISARTYGVYVTDVNVFDSAQRQVEYITIPGRNGQFALDHGRFENVTVVYSCAMGADSDTDFADAISDFRNALASAKGYKRLEDEMNPNEYRMAVFSAGITAPTLNQRTATFDVEFNCKPQRYLASGETAVSVASGGTISNPTSFDASPLIECGGTGVIDIDGQTITLTNDPIGKILLANGTRSNGEVWQDFSTTRLAAGDDIYTEQDGTIAFDVSGTGTTRKVTAITNVVASGAATTATASVKASAAQFLVKFGALTFDNGMASTQTASVSFTMTYEDGGTTSTGNYSASFDIDYDGNGEIAHGDIAYCSNIVDNLPTNFWVGLRGVTVPALYGDSTMLPITGTLYFDTDIGEAYTEIGGDIVSVNSAVDFGTNLPVLYPGTNTITYPSSITDFKIVPRWWVV